MKLIARIIISLLLIHLSSRSSYFGNRSLGSASRLVLIHLTLAIMYLLVYLLSFIKIIKIIVLVFVIAPTYHYKGY